MHLKHAETETPSKEIEDMEMKQMENNTMAKIKTKQNNNNRKLCEWDEQQNGRDRENNQGILKWNYKNDPI